VGSRLLKASAWHFAKQRVWHRASIVNASETEVARGRDYRQRTIPMAGASDRQLWVDSVEKVALSLGLGQNLLIGQRESTQHDGTVIEWAGPAVLLVQS
jgi:hypothetical protein